MSFHKCKILCTVINFLVLWSISVSSLIVYYHCCCYCYRCCYFILEKFFLLVKVGVLSLESEWQQVSVTLLNILADRNNVMVWMVSICFPISNSSSPFFKPLGTVPSAPGDKWYHRYFNIPRFSLFSCKILCEMQSA